MSAAAIARFALDEPFCCAVCRRRAWAIGYAPPRYLVPKGDAFPILWCCAAAECVRAVKQVFTMSDKQFDAYETKAIADAGDHAGAYLDSIDKSDLGKLTAVEWTTFLGEVMKGFEDSMKRQMARHEAPF